MERIILASVALLLILAGCTNTTTNQQSEEQNTEHGEIQHEENVDMDHGNMEGMEGHMDHENIPSLQASEGTQELVIPPLLEKQEDSDFDYEVVAQEGETQFFDGSPTKTYGYNGNLLGPTLQLKEGETVKVKVRNELNEPTTFHWHGLEIPGTEDGGPNDVIQPGESKIVTLKADQPAATLWYHPHPHKSTAEQVFKGLAGMLYVEETDEEAPALPRSEERRVGKECRARRAAAQVKEEM